jgi:hypothetical protein
MCKQAVGVLNMHLSNNKNKYKNNTYNGFDCNDDVSVKFKTVPVLYHIIF